MTGKVIVFTRKLCSECQAAKARLAEAGVMGRVEVVELDGTPTTTRQMMRAAERLALYTMLREATDTLPLFVIEHRDGPRELTHKVERVVEHLGRLRIADCGLRNEEGGGKDEDMDSRARGNEEIKNEGG